MRREFYSIAAMAGVLVGSQLAAVALAPLFVVNKFQAFQNPGDVANTVIYIIMILGFTAVILALVRYRRQNLARYVIMASIFVTLAFIVLLPLFYAFDFVTGGRLGDDFLVNLSTLVAFVVAGLLVYALLKFPEWYVVDTVGIVTAVGVTAILGISFGTIPALLLLVALAIYDAWAVYRTKHMITLADELTSQRLPILLVIPKKAGYSFRTQKRLKEQVATGEEREAMFVGLGDVIIPGILSVSAFTFLTVPGRFLLGLEPNAFTALGAIIGSLVGFLILMRFVLKGNPQAGLPLLNGGAIIGFLITNFLAYGYLNLL